MKKMWILAAISAICAVFVFGLWGGQVFFSNGQTPPLTEQNNVQTTIAVVNSDAGVEVDNVRQNFATAMIDTLSEDFVLVSPAMAERGYLDGTYGAVVTFPSNLSDRVLSFNVRQPERVQLDFMVNPNLSEQDYVDTHRRLMDVQLSMNTTLSQTFISSLYSQFHAAQDHIEFVFENDASTIQALDVIYFRNFTTGLELTEIPDIPFNPNDLDTSEYLLTVTDMAENISGMYLDSYNQATTDYGTMRDNVIALTDNFQTQQDDWIANLYAWTGITQGFGTDLEEFVLEFGTKMEEWRDEWDQWYEELVAYEENVEDYSAHVYAWRDRVMEWRGDFVVFNDTVNERVGELNERLYRFSNATDIRDDLVAWHGELSGYAQQSHSEFNRNKAQLANANDYWRTLAGWRSMLGTYQRDIEDWNNDWETAPETLRQAIVSHSSMAAMPTGRPAIPPLPTLPQAIRDNTEFADFAVSFDALINWSNATNTWGTNMVNWGNGATTWGNDTRTLLNGRILDFLNTEIPNLDSLPNIPNEPQFTIDIRPISWEYNLNLLPPSHPIKEFLEEIDLLHLDRLMPREELPKLPEYPEFDRAQPPIDLPEFSVPENPLTDPAPKPDNFWASLSLKYGMLNTFTPDNYLTDANRQQVQGMLSNYASYLEFIRGDVELHFNKNVMMLNETYKGYSSYLIDLRSEIMQSEADSIDHLHGLLGEYENITTENSADTQSRLSDFANMMPESRTQDGINQELVDFTILPVEAVPLAARPSMGGVFESDQRTMLFIVAIAAGCLSLITGATYIVSHIWRRKQLEK